MNGTPYSPASLAPQTDDSNRTLALKIAALLHASATGDGRGDPPSLDDSEQDALYKACALLYGATQGDVVISFGG